jgi:hypothetical protein
MGAKLALSPCKFSLKKSVYLIGGWIFVILKLLWPYLYNTSNYRHGKFARVRI